MSRRRRLPCRGGKPWWSWVCNKTTLLIIGGLIIFYVIATLEYVLHWRWFGTPVESTNVYIDTVRAFFTLLGYLLLVTGIEADRQISSLELATVEQINVESDLLEPEEYSETTRFLQSLYADNHALQEAEVDESALDRNLRRFVEALIGSEMISAINATITDNLQQTQGTVNIWRSWFRSPTIQSAWKNDRQFYSCTMNTYVEQMLMPSSCQPLPPLLVRLARNPLTIINIIVALLVVLGTIWWWTYFAQFFTPPLATSLYIKSFEALFISALILLLAFEVNRKAQETRVIEDQLEVDSQEEFVRSHYPESVRFYKQLYPCDTRLQRVEVPLDSDENKEILFNAMFSRILLIDMQISLTIEPTPSLESLTLWRSWFSSPILQEEFSYNERRCFLDTHTLNVVNRCVLPFVICPTEFVMGFARSDSAEKLRYLIQVEKELQRDDGIFNNISAQDPHQQYESLCSLREALLLTGDPHMIDLLFDANILSSLIPILAQGEQKVKEEKVSSVIKDLCEEAAALVLLLTTGREDQVMRIMQSDVPSIMINLFRTSNNPVLVDSAIATLSQMVCVKRARVVLHRFGLVDILCQRIEKRVHHQLLLLLVHLVKDMPHSWNIRAFPTLWSVVMTSESLETKTLALDTLVSLTKFHGSTPPHEKITLLLSLDNHLMDNLFHLLTLHRPLVRSILQLLGNIASTCTPWKCYALLLIQKQSYLQAFFTLLTSPLINDTVQAQVFWLINLIIRVSPQEYLVLFATRGFIQEGIKALLVSSKAWEQILYLFFTILRAGSELQQQRLSEARHLMSTLIYVLNHTNKPQIISLLLSIFHLLFSLPSTLTPSNPHPPNLHVQTFLHLDGTGALVELLSHFPSRCRVVQSCLQLLHHHFGYASVNQ